MGNELLSAFVALAHRYSLHDGSSRAMLKAWGDVAA
tara:strand:+ start:135 stop:242 length:108 start_codon:yes stop_codon:yes gene_type:complete